MELATKLLTDAVAVSALDILLLPTKTCYQVKYFIRDYYLVQSELTFEQAQKLLAFFKFKADMMLSEHRRPQLGAWQQKIGEQPLYLRFSTVGDFLGRESMVIRLIYPLKSIKYHYLVPEQWALLEQVCQKRGLVIFAGPMGSGKTTAMYQLAKAQKQQQVMCIEDPIEIREDSFLQVQVNPKAQMDYSTLLKAALRHHPDIFIVGEIRDQKTARAVLTAALSGHLVLSTLHATSAYGVIERLADLGITRSELKSVLQLVSYQRLLPLKSKGQAVLFDIIQQAELFSENVKQENNGMSADWGRYLEQNATKGKITIATAKKFAHG